MARKPDLVLPRYSDRLFRWDAGPADCLGLGMADASDLAAGQYADRIWKDSLDVGFWVTSTRRKVDVLFLHVGTRHDPSGEVLSETFESADGFRIVVFND